MMAKKAKHERRAEAITAELQRTIDRLYALSAAFLRVQTAYEKYREEAAKLFAADRTDEDLDKLVESIPKRVARLESDELIRSGSLMMVQLGLLYALIEAWRKWDFDHPAVDELLESDFVKELKDYRHAVFHVNEITDRRIMQWTAGRDRVAWVVQVLDGFHIALLDWHGRLAERVTIKVGRRPL